MKRLRKRPYPIDIKLDREKLHQLAKRGKPRDKRERRFRRSLRQKAMYEDCLYKCAQLEDDLAECRKHRISDDEEEGEKDCLLPTGVVHDEQANGSSVPAEEDSTSSSSSDAEDEAGSDACELLAQNRRKHASTDERRTLLPIRTISGRVIRVHSSSTSLPSAVDSEESEEQQNSAEQKRPNKVEPLSAVQLYAERQRLLTELKSQIAGICSNVVCDPWQNIGSLSKVLQIVYDQKYAPVLQTAIKLACTSLTEVFADIAPGYCISLTAMDETARKYKKETKQLWNFEKTLVANYQTYLKFLESFLKRLKRDTDSRFNRKIGLFSVQQLCQLLLRLSHFNYRINLLSVLVPLMSCREANIRSTVCDTFCQLFDDDQTGNVSLDAVRLINQFMHKKRRVWPEMLETLLHLRIKNVSKATVQDDSQPRGKRQDPFRTLSRRHQKYYKTLRHVQYHLKEIDADETERTIQKCHTKITEHLFNIYFRVLRNNPDRRVLHPVLEGLSCFAHLINVSFFDCLLSDMRNLLNLKSLSVLDSLNCIHAVLIVLSKEGEALNVDTYYFQNRLYQLFPKIVSEKRRDLFLKEFQKYLRCLDIAINKRRKEIGRHRVAAFMKRMCIGLDNMQTPELVASLLAIRSYLLSHPNLGCLVDDEEPCSFSVYQPDLDDLEQSGALGTKLNELVALQQHKSKLVRWLASDVLSNCTQSGVGGISPTLLNESPDAVLIRLSESAVRGRQKQ